MADQIDQLRKEDIRKAVRAHLNDRIGTALSEASIQRGVRSEWNTDEREVKAALSYLTSTEPQQVNALPDGDGATLYYRITASGVKAHERSC